MSQRFGEKLRYLRQRADLTQLELARRLSLATHAHISNLELAQDTPSLHIISAVAQLFDCSVDYLLRDEIDVTAVIPPRLINSSKEQQHREFGDRLRTLRLQRGFSQRQLMGALGLASRTTISDIESGRRSPSLGLLVRLVEVLGVTADELLLDT